MLGAGVNYEWADDCGHGPMRADLYRVGRAGSRGCGVHLACGLCGVVDEGIYFRTCRSGFVEAAAVSNRSFGCANWRDWMMVLWAWMN